MSDTKFTPGPWKAVVTTCEDDIEFFGAEPDEDLIGGIAHPMHSGLDYETTQANASLIAAAPDLYAIGERIENQITLWAADVFELPDAKLEEDIIEIVLNVRECREILSVLAKARGEAKP